MHPPGSREGGQGKAQTLQKQNRPAGSLKHILHNICFFHVKLAGLRGDKDPEQMRIKAAQNPCLLPPPPAGIFFRQMTRDFTGIGVCNKEGLFYLPEIGAGVKHAGAYIQKRIHILCNLLCISTLHPSICPHGTGAFPIPLRRAHTESRVWRC